MPHAYTGFAMGVGSIKNWHPGFSGYTGFKMGLRGLGITCPAGQHDYTPDGVNHICEDDVYTVAADYSNVGIQAEAAALPNDPIGTFESKYGGLTNSKQEDVISCQEFIGANAITGQAIPPNCANLVGMTAPYVPNVNPISPPPPNTTTSTNPSSTRQVITPRAGGGQITHANPTPASSNVGSWTDQVRNLFSLGPTASDTNVNAPIADTSGTTNANTAPQGSADANAVSTAPPSSITSFVSGLSTTEIVIGLGAIALIGYFMMKGSGPTYVGR